MAVSTALLLLAAIPGSSAYPWLAQRRSAAPVPAESLPLPIPTLLPVATPPDPNDPRFTQFKPPGPGDVRSPCPGLNACANHGFIPHSGRGNTYENLIPGLSQCFNMGEDFTLAIGGAGFLASPDPLLGSFDLDQLDQHNFPIEHDASVSRDDAFFGDDHSFNAGIFNESLSYYDGMEYTSIEQAAKLRHGRFTTQKARNPTFTFGLREFLFAYGETAIYLQAMSDPFSGKAKVDYIKEWFEQEKLPYDIGWRPSAQPITLETLGQMVLELFANNPEEIPEGITITVDTVKDVFSGIDPLTGLIANATSNL
ncbi:MAG: hypothetical protein Q9159_003423 [Coniocarpon cinnabarinum]